MVGMSKMNSVKRLYRLRLAAAEAMAVELSDRGEKHAASTIAGLLDIIDDLAPQEPRQEPEMVFGIDIDSLSVGSRIESDGRVGTVTLIDKEARDPAAHGRPVILVDWVAPHDH